MEPISTSPISDVTPTGEPPTPPGSASPRSSKAVKLLLSHRQCGAVIGKSGAGFLSIQSIYDVWSKLAGTDDVFPGTRDRCFFISGSNATLPAALDALLVRLHEVTPQFRYTRTC